MGARTSRSVGGAAGAVGGRFHAHAPDSETAYLNYENVEVEPLRRRTIRIHTADGSFIGYSSWSLTETGDTTTVAYNVYCQWPMPAETDVAAMLPELNRTALLPLKAAVEAEIAHAG